MALTEVRPCISCTPINVHMCVIYNSSNMNMHASVHTLILNAQRLHRYHASSYIHTVNQDLLQAFKDLDLTENVCSGHMTLF